jgi:hypothetical protein
VHHPPGDRVGDRRDRHGGRDHGPARGAGGRQPAAAGARDRHGSLFFSHVNDAGFWLINQYFGMSVVDTIKTWSVMETVISVVGMACVMAMTLIV